MLRDSKKSINLFHPINRLNRLRMYSQRMLKLGARFEGRLEPVFLECALDYVKCNEENLALEIFCDHICEYDVALAADEFMEIRQLALDMGFDVGKAPFKYLEGLTKSGE